MQICRGELLSGHRAIDQALAGSLLSALRQVYKRTVSRGTQKESLAGARRVDDMRAFLFIGTIAKPANRVHPHAHP